MLLLQKHMSFLTISNESISLKTLGTESTTGPGQMVRLSEGITIFAKASFCTSSPVVKNTYLFS